MTKGSVFRGMYVAFTTKHFRIKQNCEGWPGTVDSLGNAAEKTSGFDFFFVQNSSLQKQYPCLNL